MNRLVGSSTSQALRQAQAQSSSVFYACRSSFLRHYTTQPEQPNITGSVLTDNGPAKTHSNGVEPLEDDSVGYPDLMVPNTLLDSHEAAVFPPTRHTPFQNRVIVRNDPSIFELQRLSEESSGNGGGMSKGADEDDELSPLAHLPLGPRELRELYKFPLITRRITQQTGKGKIHRMYALVVVGNGDGLVGYGEGKDEEAPRATDKAFAQAVRSMDYVERFEKRTLWTEMDSKLGATHIILRPRPVGFGLHCNPNVHQILKAAGIKDASAKVWGSRNPLSVTKALFRMLQAGNAPLSMGDGIGGRARRLDKGSGLRSKDAVERERGRKLVDLRTW